MSRRNEIALSSLRGNAEPARDKKSETPDQTARRHDPSTAAKRRSLRARFHLPPLAQAATGAIIAGPVAAGLLGTMLPAFGWLPSLGGHAFSLAPWRELFATPGLLASCLLSLWVGLVSAVLSFGTVMLFLAGWRDTRAFAAMLRLLSPLLALPHAAAAFGLAFLIAPSGLLARLLAAPLGLDRPPDILIIHDPWGLSLIAGLAAKETPFLLLMALAALSQIDADRSLRTTTSLGVGRITGFLVAVLPRLYPQLRLPIAAVIAWSASTVDVSLILGPTTPPTLSLALVRMMNDPDLTQRFPAAAGALVQAAIVLAALGVWGLGEILGRRLIRRLAENGARGRSDRLWKPVGFILASLVAAVVLVGLISLGLWSTARAWRWPDLLPSALGLTTWARIAPMLAETTLRSLGLALCVTATALLLTIATLAARAPGRSFSAFLYAPLIVPQIAFLFGLQTLFSGVEKTFAPLALTHLVFVLPYVFLSLRGPWRALDPRYETTARALGASRARAFFTVRLPLLLRPILTAAALGMSVSLSLFLPTLLVAAGRFPTVTTEAVALASGGDRRLVGAWALAQALLPALAFTAALALPALLYRNRRGMRP